MITTLRAALSVLMLLGFYVLALGIVGGLGVLTFLLAQDRVSAGTAKLGYVTVVVAIAILVALWKVARSKPEPMPGVVVTPDHAPELWQQVRDLASQANTRSPEEIRLIPMVNAAVSEDAKLLGLVGGKRRLYLGIPLMQALTVSQLRSVLAHELGHYSRNHTRLGEVAYRGKDVMVATVAQLSGNLVGWLLKQYAKLYMLVTAAVSRRQELEADELSVRVAGRATAQGTLRELPVIDMAWNFYQGRYIAPGWEAGYAPRATDFFRGFGDMLVARTDELAALREEAPPADQSKWDSHPSIAARVAAMDAMPDTVAGQDGRAATALIPMFDQASEAVATQAVKYEQRTQLPWDQFSSAAALAEEQRQADVIYRAAARFAGVPSGGLSTVLDVVEAGRLGEFAVAFFDDATKREAAERFAGPMTLLLRVAAARSGVATWRHSWTGAPTAIGRDGQPLELAEVAALAVKPETLGDAKGRLAALGIDLAAAVAVNTVATAHGGDIVAGLATTDFNGAPHDLLVLDNGLILRPCPKSTDGGKNRLIQLAESAPVAQLAAANTFLPFEEFAEVKLLKRFPVRVEITLRDGRTMKISQKWNGEDLAKNSTEVFREAMEQFVTEPAAR